MNNIASPTFPFSIETWTARAATHSALIAPMTDAFLKRRSVGKSHPVHDFLFTYYNCSPGKLSQWVPSYQEQLIITPELKNKYFWLDSDYFQEKENILSSNLNRIQNNTLDLLHFIKELCQNLLERPPRFGCFGLHEWAMVYKLSPEALRHQLPLRMPSDQLAAFVESQNLCCSHYDAYRFFTKEARPLNILDPLLETRLQMEQAGCIHANMDLYKWSSKLWPWIGSDFLAKCFFLALDCRELDMRASPYDLKEYGYLPIPIETEEGRKDYQKSQQSLTEKSQILRRELLHFCQSFSVKEKE